MYDFEVTNIPDNINHDDLKSLCSKTEILDIHKDHDPLNWF